MPTIGVCRFTVPFFFNFDVSQTCVTLTIDLHGEENVTSSNFSLTENYHWLCLDHESSLSNFCSHRSKPAGVQRGLCGRARESCHFADV